ncbi:hypothetical protein RUND412_003836 [Rhizina undulata]
MDRLANKILQKILSHLSASDLASVRLVSRRFSAAATIFKFRLLRVRINRKGLDNLLDISRKLELAECVREIIYPFGRLPLLELPNLDEEEQYITQIELEECGECVRTLSTALSRMPNIRGITSGYSNSGLMMRDMFKTWLKTFTNNDRTINQWVKMLAWNLWEPITKGDKQALKPTLDLIITTHRLGIKLDRLEFIIVWCWLGIFRNNSELWGCAPLFENLTSLSVYITNLDSLEDLEGTKKVEETTEVSYLRPEPSQAISEWKITFLHGGAPFPPTKQELEENGWDMSNYLECSYDDLEEEEDE